MRTREEVLAEIEMGARVCERLKSCYYPATPWIDVYQDVQGLFDQAKKKAGDGPILERLKWLLTHSGHDLRRLIRNE